MGLAYLKEHLSPVSFTNPTRSHKISMLQVLISWDLQLAGPRWSVFFFFFAVAPILWISSLLNFWRSLKMNSWGGSLIINIPPSIILFSCFSFAFISFNYFNNYYIIIIYLQVYTDYCMLPRVTFCGMTGHTILANTF